MKTNYKKMYSDPTDRLIAEILDLYIATQFDQTPDNPDIQRLIALEDKLKRITSKHQIKEPT